MSERAEAPNAVKTVFKDKGKEKNVVSLTSVSPDCGTYQSIQINDIYVKNIRYTVYLIWIATIREELQNMLSVVYNASKKYGMMINIWKTKSMKINKHSNTQSRQYLWSNGE